MTRPASSRDACAPRVCDWCGRAFVPKREHAVCCSTKCRKSRHRFGSECVPRRRADASIRLAYADPPYPGLAHLYRDHPDYGGEVDHAALVEQLGPFDGWALSTSSDALGEVLALARSIERRTVHVAAWFRGARPSSTALRPRAAWEPVIYCGGRARADSGPDALVHGARPRTSDPKRVIGAKPAPFAFWLFDLLGALPGDELADLFPGSGGITRAWSVYCSRAVSQVDASRLAGNTRPGRPLDASRSPARRVPSSSSTDTRPVLLEHASRRSSRRVPAAGSTRH